MLKSALILSTALALTAGAATAQVVHTGDAKSPIASVVSVPPGYGIVYVAGLTAGGMGSPIPPDMDTKAQSLIVFEKLKAALAGEGLTFGDVTMMNVYLAADPNKGGKMDSAGMNEAFKQYFGTADQPNKPARVTFQVGALGGPTTLVEISLQAAKPPAKPKPMAKKKK